MLSVLLLILPLLGHLCLCEKLKVYYNATDEEYDRMPTLFELDNFDECMNLKNTLYCYTTIQLSPVDEQEPSEIWNIIQAVISVKRTYRHDRLRHGICVPKTCPKISSNYYEIGNGSEEIWNGIAECYTNKYATSGLKGVVTKIHCQSKESLFDIDSIDILYAICIGILIFIVIISTIYEGCVRQYPPELYRRLTEESKLGRLLMCFSIIRNWQRLRSDSKSPHASALAPIQGVRVFNMYFVVMSHTIMILAAGPSYNPRYIEDSTLRYENMFVLNGSLICQTFFLLSGWFLSYNFCLMFENKTVKLGHLFMAFVNRLIRLVPLVLLAVGFSATWLRHLDRGPVWDHVVASEFRNCRKNWLANILFINNYYGSNEMCLQQTWSLCVDTHCFILGLFIMMLVLKNPQNANKIFGTFIALGIALSFVHNYYINTDIVYRNYGEDIYTMYMEHQQWQSTFIASEMGIPSYVQGMMFGFYFYKLKKENRSFLTNRFHIFLWHVFGIGVPLMTVLIAGSFYKEGSDHTRFQALFYQSLSRYIFGMPVGLIIYGMTLGAGRIMIAVVSWAPLQFLARVTFSAFIVHVWPMRMLYGATRMPLYLSNYDTMVKSYADFVISIGLGTIVCLIVEMPLSALLKLMSPKQDKFKEE